jgi:hypothetical protein
MAVRALEDRRGLSDELTIHSFRAGFATALHKGSGDVVLVSRAWGIAISGRPFAISSST